MSDPLKFEIVELRDYWRGTKKYLVEYCIAGANKGWRHCESEAEILAFMAEVLCKHIK